MWWSFLFVFIYLFLVACTRLYNPLCPSVSRSVTFYFFLWFYFLTSLPLPKWSSDLKYGPCPPARDFGSRVSGLVIIKPEYCKNKENYLIQRNLENYGVKWIMVLNEFTIWSKRSGVRLEKISILRVLKKKNGPITDFCTGDLKRL